MHQAKKLLVVPLCGVLLVCLATATESAQAQDRGVIGRGNRPLPKPTDPTKDVNMQALTNCMNIYAVAKAQWAGPKGYSEAVDFCIKLATN